MPSGRPSKYVSEFHIPWTRSLARRGLTMPEIAREMSIGLQTLKNWCKNDPLLLSALNEGRDAADSKIEDSLYKKALGYTITEKRTIVSAAPDGQQKPARIEVFEKEVPPDTTACIFWLKNRQSKYWRDQSNITLETTSDDEARNEIEAAIAALKKKDVE